MLQGKSRELTIVFTVVIVAVCAAGDYLWPVINRNSSAEWLAVAGIGALSAEAMLLAVWAVFARMNIVVRFASSLFFGLWMWYLLVFSPGNAAAPYQATVYARFNLLYGVVLLVGVLLLQASLWIVKLSLGVRMLAPGEPPAPPAPQRFQFQLKDLLIATLIAALAISPMRFVLPKEDVSGPNLGGYLFVVLLVIPYLPVNLVATLPSLWAAYARPRFAAALAGYCLLISAVEVPILWISHAPIRTVAEGFAIVIVFNFAQCGIVYGVMRIYYALGFRLRRVPRQAPHDAA